VVVVSFAHKQIVEVFQVLLKKLKCLSCVIFVCKLFTKCLDNFVQSVKKTLLESFDGVNVGLHVKRILKVLDPSAEFISKVDCFILQIGDPIQDFINSILIDSIGLR
jgi:hypothetical protein